MDKYPDKTSAEMAQAKQAWDGAIPLLKNAGMSDRQARSFFGKLLSKNHISADILLGAVHLAKQNGTQDPASYLTAAACRVKSSVNDPALKCGWT